MAPESVATDWPQFRGPNRDGIWNETGILESFPEKGVKIRWRHPVGGGFSSPVVAQGRVFVFDVELTKPTSRERLHCFRGKDRQGPLGFSATKNITGNGLLCPSAAPVPPPLRSWSRDGFTSSARTATCIAWMSKQGRLSGRKTFGQEYTVEEMGCRPSPLIEGSLLIVFTGAKPGATVLALG